MHHQTKALTEVQDALRRAVRCLFDVQVEIYAAKVAQAKADALRALRWPPKREERSAADKILIRQINEHRSLIERLNPKT